LVVELANPKAAGSRRKTRHDVIDIPWSKTPAKRRREVLTPQDQTTREIRPIRSENRATLVASIARGRRWLDELIAAPTTNAESIGKREGCTARQVNMTISLAFLAPDLVKAAIQGKLPHGMGVRRLRDLPPEWHRQRQTLGL
jgi:site-specific DNA recombinase